MTIEYIKQDFYDDSLDTKETRLVEYMNQFQGSLYLESTIIRKDSDNRDYLVAIFSTEAGVGPLN